MTALRARLAAVDPVRLDAIVAIIAIIELELQSSFGRGISDVDRLVTVLACVLYAGPIAVRRRAPGLALVFCAAVAAIQTPLDGQLWSWALRRDRRRRDAGARAARARLRRRRLAR